MTDKEEQLAHSTGDEEQALAQAPGTSDQTSKQRRAEFIRQASQPFVRRNRSSYKRRASSEKQEPAPSSTQSDQPGRSIPGIDEAEGEDAPDADVDDEGPLLHTRWLRSLDSGKGWESFLVKDSRNLEAAWKK